jgi:hypothetical protein
LIETVSLRSVRQGNQAIFLVVPSRSGHVMALDGSGCALSGQRLVGHALGCPRPTAKRPAGRRILISLGYAQVRPYRPAVTARLFTL